MMFFVDFFGAPTLQRYGGLWLDPAIICLKPFEFYLTPDLWVETTGWEVDQKQLLMTQLSERMILGEGNIKQGWRITSSLFWQGIWPHGIFFHVFFRTSTGVVIEDDTFLDSLRVLACEESCEGAQCPLKTHCWTWVKKWWLRFCVPSGKLT